MGCIFFRKTLNRVSRSLFALDGDGLSLKSCGGAAWSFEAERGDEIKALPGFDRHVNGEGIVYYDIHISECLNIS